MDDFKMSITNKKRPRLKPGSKSQKMIYNCSKDGVKYVIKKTGTINMDEQLIVLTVNKKGEHNHLTSFNEIHLSSNNGETSNNGALIAIMIWKFLVV